MLQLTEVQEALRDSVRRVVKKEVVPIAESIEQAGEFPMHLVPIFGDMGLMQVRVPEKYGGPGLDLTTTCLLKEEVCKVSLSCGNLVNNNTIGMAMPLLHFGSEAQREKWLPLLAQGRTITCVAMSEPQAGSDVAAILTTAKRDGDHYVLNGEKSCITMSGAANYALVFAKSDAARGVNNISCFIVDTRSEGFMLGRKEITTGIRAVPHNSIFLDDVRVPAENRIGEEGKGFTAAMRILDMNRPVVAASALGLAQGAFEAAVAYAKERRAFGKSISEFQAIQFMLADMAMQIEAARALLYSCTQMIDRGDYTKLSEKSSMVKLFNTEMCQRVTTDAGQIFGAVSYMQGSPIERMIRDARSFPLVEGTSQIMRMVIGRSVLADR